MSNTPLFSFTGSEVHKCKATNNSRDTTNTDYDSTSTNTHAREAMSVSATVVATETDLDSLFIDEEISAIAEEAMEALAVCILEISPRVITQEDLPQATVSTLAVTDLSNREVLCTYLDPLT